MLEPRRVQDNACGEGSKYAVRAGIGTFSGAGPDPAIPAAQYFGTKGFFGDYDARLGQPLSEAVARAWADGLSRLNKGTLDPNESAARVEKAESENSPPTGRTRREMILELWERLTQRDME